jgi:hypothetical protein
MNWKKGLFRVWVLVSIAWLIYPCYLLVEQIRGLGDDITLHDGEAKFIFPGDLPRDEVHTALVKLMQEQDPRSNPVESDKWADKVMAGYEPRTFIGPIYQFVKIGLGPPIGAFVLGCGLWWTVAGFRSKAPS